MLGERVHPASGAHLIYVACDVVAGTAHVVAPDEVDAVQWAAGGELSEYVPHGFYEPIEAHLR